MQPFYIFKHSLFVCSFILILTQCNNPKGMSDIKAPIAEKIKKELVIHGDTRIDYYYWLNQREDPKVMDYLNRENAYTDTMMSDTKALQDKLYNEIIGRIKQDDESVPYKDNGYFYYTRYEKGGEYPIYCRKKERLEAPEEILLNVNELAKGYEYYQVASISISPDNRYMIYGVDTLSRRLYTLYFKDLITGKILKDEIPNTTGSATWANDNTTLFYTQKNEETLRPHKVLRHTLGVDITKDKLVFQEEDETFMTYVFKSRSKAYIFIGSFSTLSSEYQYLDASNPLGAFQVFQPREKDHEYDVYHYGDQFYIRTNLDAKNFKLVKTPVNKTRKENWVEVLPHRADVLLEDVVIFNQYMVVNERIKGLSNLRVISWADGSEHYLDFGEETYSAWTTNNREFDTDWLRYGYTSLTTPNSTFDYNMKTKEKKLLKQQEVVGGYEASDYQAKRLYTMSRDGIEIPISLVYKKGIALDGSNPLFLYAYGSYGSSTDAYFSYSRLSLLDRGFIYAIAHVRGGEELGRQWYEDGKLLNKKNTFTDFIDCGEYLVSQKYTNPDKLFAYGGSAGGLLIGAVVNMRPDLFKGVIAAVPFVDVLTTMLDENIPLTTGEYDEWGNPNIKEYYDYIKSYSPYDNVEAKDYPNILVTTGLHDSQVQYWEPAKWVAKLRDMKTDNNILLLYTNMDAGHGGASGRFKVHKETAMEYAFFLKLLGIYE
ncbi:MAG: S9 family peptidase [Bacteroidales bacterium]|nr:S9 family peptidase [Bacteroidales bacterium]